MIIASILGAASSLVTLGLSSVGAYTLGVEAGAISVIPAIENLINSF